MAELQTLIPYLVKAGIEFIIIGGVAATAHGSSYVTEDLDICYARNNANLKRLAAALAPFHPRLRGAPEDVPFLWDAETLRRGLNPGGFIPRGLPRIRHIGESRYPEDRLDSVSSTE